MSAAAAPDRGAIAFAERLLTVLDEGRKSATYKCAVLIGLMDLCLEQSSAAGAPPRSVTVSSLAEKVIGLYWPHIREFPGRQRIVLKQNSGGQIGIVRDLERFAAKVAGAGGSLPRARHAASDLYATLVRSVEWRLAQMPLPRVQRVGTSSAVFLYEIGWSAAVTRGQYFGPNCDRRIHFAANAAEHLVRLSALLRPVIQREWTRLVAQLNREHVPEAQLEEFLFGAERVSTAPIRGELRELQDGRCFYCEARLRGDGHVDHFVPWSRHPDNGLDNLVVADDRCNGAKSDRLAAADYVDRWRTRATRHKADLAEIAARKHWEHEPDRSLSAARSIYLRLPEDALLWSESEGLVPFDRPVLERIFNA